MLYDPKWGKPSLEGFIAWLKQQNPDATYHYWPCEGCLIDQYMQSLGACHTDLAGRQTALATAWNKDIAILHPRTFGAALERARATLTSAEGTTR